MKMEYYKKLLKLKYSPYFGRIDFKEEDSGKMYKVYIGLAGVEDNLNYIGAEMVKLEEANLSNYERKYLELELLVPSLRLDIIVSKICHVSRNQAKKIILSDSVLVNYVVQNNISYLLKENDVFSIKKVGKFKYIEIINKTKSNNLVISVKKYI